MTPALYMLAAVVLALVVTTATIARPRVQLRRAGGRVSSRGEILRKLAVLWCRITGRHTGHVYYTHRGPYWRCDNCLEVVR